MENNEEQNYDFKTVEEKWIQHFRTQKLYQQLKDNTNKKKFYCLEMFAYPSGNIHMGHVRNYSLGDVLARYKHSKGYDVLHPVGWDSFGLPAENAAIENGANPETWTFENIAKMTKQFQRLGFYYDWDNTVTTAKEDYYKWGQWLFIRMFEKGLIYQKESKVNWCDSCNTVLANEQVVDGKCWRHSNLVVKKKNLKQWFIRITDYADALLDDHHLLEEHWPSEVLSMQKNWIHRSHGVMVNFQHEKGDFPIFTTRPDTLFGVTFCAIAFDHPKLEQYLSPQLNRKELDAFIKECEETDQSQDFDKKGLFTQSHVINPINGDKIPLYVTNFVLGEHGTGAIMCVPAHDQRDFEFAKKYNLPLKMVIQNANKSLNVHDMESAYTEEGTLVNSGEFDGKNNQDAMLLIADLVEKKKWGQKQTQYKLKDWLISRQRYWGNPIPLVHCDTCGVVAEKDSNLPIKLPTDVNFASKDNPIKTSPTFLSTACPKCGKPAKRETDTMDTFFCSSWYFLRYTDPHNTQTAFDFNKQKHWMAVDKYIGGIEHACMHLLYARFMHKALKDMSLASGDEPFASLLTQGMVLANSYYDKEKRKYYSQQEYDKLDANTQSKIIIKMEKMGKSKKNGIDPDQIIAQYGSDTARLFILFAAPPNKKLEWNPNAIEGCSRFLKRIWSLSLRLKTTSVPEGQLSDGVVKLKKSYHKTVKKVDEDSNELRLNTAIAAMMEFFNEMNATLIQTQSDLNEFKNIFLGFLKILNPYTPSITEEINAQLDFDTLLWKKTYPVWDANEIQSDEIEYIIQINGKLRSKIVVAINMPKDEILKQVKNQEVIQKWLSEGQLQKEIFVPNKLVNLVVN